MHQKPLLPLSVRRLFAALFTAIFASFSGAQEEGSLAGKVAVLTVSEFTLIESSQTDGLIQNLKKARTDGAAAVVLEIDSRAGFAISTRRVVEEIAKLGAIKSYALIKGEVLAGPALVALATDEIYFAPGASIGSAKDQEVEWRGPKAALPDRLVDKTYSDFAEIFKAAAVASGREAVLVSGLLDPAVEVKIGEKVYSETDDILKLDATSPVAKGKAESVDALIQTAGLGAEAITLSYEATQVEAPLPEPSKPTAVPAPEPELPFGKTREESYAGKVVVIEIGEWTLMRQTKFDFMSRILDKAVADGAEAIIFEMNTPGGQLEATETLMFKLQNVKVPTYTFVNTEASSAGSLIAIATDKIYMHQPSTIGSAAIVSSMGEIDPIMREKIESKFLDSVDAIARSKNRDPDLCKAFVKMDLEYAAEIPVVAADGTRGSREVFKVAKGELLSFSADEALQMIDGKPLFAAGTVQTIEELIEREGLTGGVVRSEPLGFEKVADFIVAIAPLLLLLALAGLYVEVNSPGFGVPGTVALVLLAIFFFGHQAAGKLAGYEVIGVFLLGIALLVVELFILPGVFIIGAIGLLLIIGSLLFAMLDRFDFSNFGGEFDWDRLLTGLGTPITNLIIALAGAAILVVFLMRYIPELPIMKKRMLVGVSSGSKRTLSSVSGGKSFDTATELIGLEGEAKTDLRPGGRGLFGERMLDVTTDAAFVDEGSALRVVAVEGSKIVVEAIG